MTSKQLHRMHVLERDRTCQLDTLGNCRGPLQAHHIISVQRIRIAHSNANSWAAKDGPLHGADLDLLIADGRNGIALCERHHRQAEWGALPGSVLPAGVFDFADEYGLRWSLERDGFVEREAA